MVLKAVNVKAKAGLRSSIMIRDSDIRCSKGHRFSYSTASKMQTKWSIAKDFYLEEFKVKEARPILFWAEASKPSKQAHKEREGKKHQKKRDKKQTPASTANATEVQQKKKKKNQDRVVNKVTYFNCNKKGHYVGTCTKPTKN